MNLQRKVDNEILRRHFLVALPIAFLYFFILDGHRMFTCFIFVDSLVLAIRILVPKKGSFLDMFLPFAASILAFFLAELTR
jgi:hypothetical protein